MAEGDGEVIRLSDMLRHTRHTDMKQLPAWLQLIDQTFKELRNDNDAELFALDRRGYCVVPAKARRNILSVWSRLVATREQGADTVKLAFPKPLATSGTVPPAPIHMDGVVPGAAATR